MIPTRPARVAVYAPTKDAHGAEVDGWAAPAEVAVYGWQPDGSAQPIEDGRRPITTDLELLTPTPAPGGPRARWTLPGEAGALEQVGEASSYNNGPWWSGAGAVVKLRRVKG